MRELSIIELDMVSGSANTAAGAALDGASSGTTVGGALDAFAGGAIVGGARGIAGGGAIGAAAGALIGGAIGVYDYYQGKDGNDYCEDGGNY